MQRRFGSDEMLWSRGMFTLLDLDPEIDKPSFSLLQSMQHPDDRLTFEEVESRSDAAIKVARKFRVIRRDGTLRILSQHAEMLFDRDGIPDRLISVVVDVTHLEAERDEADIMLKQLKAIAQLSGMILHVSRPDGFVMGLLGQVSDKQEIEFNRRYGFAWREIIHPDDREESVRQIDAALAQGLPGSREHRIMEPEGGYRWRRTTWIPIFDRRNKFRELLSISEDIEPNEASGASEKAEVLPTGVQIRAARAILRWSVQKLSEAGSVSPSVVRRIEEFDGTTEGASASLQSIRHALEAAGIEFLFPRTGKPSVRLY